MQEIQTEEGTVKVTNMPTRTLYYRGRYFRTTLTVATTSAEFRMISAATFFGHQYAVRWFATTGEINYWASYRYDSSRCEWGTPF